MSDYVKLGSLGNNFVFFDYYKTTPRGRFSENYIKELCKKENVDGVLLLYQGDKAKPLVKIFNSDGSNGQVCINGARCVARYLREAHDFPRNINIFMGDTIIKSVIDENSRSVTQYIGGVRYNGEKKISVNGLNITGYIVNAGNPHFIILQNHSLDWLKKHGPAIENHESFPNKTNVEVLWAESPLTYKMLVHERGCGITKACSSGAVAATWLLYKQNKIKINQKIKICMLGGTVTTWAQVCTGQYGNNAMDRAIFICLASSF